MKCEKCGKQLKYIELNRFSLHNGSDFYSKHTYKEEPQDAVVIDTDNFWTGYELEEDEQIETIRCPYCHEFPFDTKDVQVYEIVRIVMFKKEKGDKENGDSNEMR